VQKGCDFEQLCSWRGNANAAMSGLLSWVGDALFGEDPPAAGGSAAAAAPPETTVVFPVSGALCCEWVSQSECCVCGRAGRGGTPLRSSQAVRSPLRCRRHPFWHTMLALLFAHSFTFAVISESTRVQFTCRVCVTVCVHVYIGAWKRTRRRRWSLTNCTVITPFSSPDHPLPPAHFIDRTTWSQRSTSTRSFRGSGR
jgi:hypothetical protein